LNGEKNYEVFSLGAGRYLETANGVDYGFRCRYYKKYCLTDNDVEAMTHYGKIQKAWVAVVDHKYLKVDHVKTEPKIRPGF